jgi:thiol-disulfide isomerase/thioredoxin
MKNKLLFCLGLLFILMSSKKSVAAGYEIKVHINHLRDSAIYLGNHYGEKQYVRDTVKLDQNGWATFSGKDSLPGGIYLIVLPGKTYFEILVNNEKFTVETDTIDYVLNMKITNSLENKLFNEHQRFLIDKTKESQELKVRLDANKDNKDSTEAIRKKINDLDKDVKQYRFEIMNKYPNTFMTKILKTMQDPEVPESVKQEAKGNDTLSQAIQFRWYKSHYLENIDFSDERLLRTPIFYNKVKTYTQQLTVPMPDSIIVSCDTIIERARANKEVFKYCVATLTNFYETSNIMGYDKVFVHLAEKYYLSKDAFWADSTLKAKIQERVEKIKPNILGTPAHNLAMPDTALQMHELYKVKAKYTILVFWDPTCSHCKVEVPKLSQYYDSVKAKGVSIEVFAIGIESDIELWKKFIRDNKLKWLNVSDLYNQTNFRAYYDIYSTPVIYLLDDQKRIIAKRLDTEKIRDFIQHEESKGGLNKGNGVNDEVFPKK